MAQAKSGTVDATLATLLHTDTGNLEFLGGLSAADQKKLASDIEAAHKAHAKHIGEKMEEALSHIPWLIRAPIKKLFGM